ncbi:hypothetical protein GCU67_09075 [Modestobacter muralis]|uniref:Uncharacterized protein n=1 Tax=Modestobacter muralis TaxID=1608614 RepID=A0A6P0ETY1_9ACTN|nr:hypothetical protein [Modestobacter muralis]NEK94323.1 hypothetical protein [Modestobacter muralis]NEN51211.1 hypothetical protein [Modestobacter muralis]
MPEPQPPTEFVGGWIHSSADFPYDFDDGTGEQIPVHLMDFAGVEHRVDPPRLTVRFYYGDPAIPSEARETPFAVFEFHDVQIWQWEDDHDLFDVPDDVRGQVESFDWYEPTNTCGLHAINTRLLFSARRLVVRVEPEVHWVAPDARAISGSSAGGGGQLL